MSNSERSPLLSADAEAEQDTRHTQAEESTPLLSRTDDGTAYDTAEAPDTASVKSRRSSTSVASTKNRRRWPSIIAITLLAVLAIIIIVGAFFVPTALEEYAKQAAVLEPTNLSLKSITTNGVTARIQANFRLDASRVKDGNVRRIGKAATWVVRTVSSGETKVHVYLPEYDNLLLGSADVPPMKVSVVEGQTTAVDLTVGLAPGDTESIRRIANEWLEGQLDQLRLRGGANVRLKAGIIPIGMHAITEYITFEANKIPTIPKYKITSMQITDKGDHAMGAEVTIEAFNKYPVDFVIPSLGFDILVPNCGLYDPYILVAHAITDTIALKPESNVKARVQGIISELPDSLTRNCPQSDTSPLDLFLKNYLDGEPATVFVRGGSESGLDTPEWLKALLASVTVPVPFPGRTFDNLIRNFSLTDVHFSFPSPLADPDDEDANPKVSGNIRVIAGLPAEMNFDIDVTNVRASADVFYHAKKLGELDLHKWQDANSTKVESAKTNETELVIQSQIKDVPLNVTDADVLSDVIEKLLFGRKPVKLDVKTLVDVKVVTVLGEMVLKEVPAEGQIPVKPISNHHNLVSGLKPKISDLEILDTTSNTMTFRAMANVTNPTPYTARIPYIGVHVYCNNSIIGQATARDLDVVQGLNSGIELHALWDPTLSGSEGRTKGRDLLSQYLSGYNTSVTVKAHNESIPGQPLLSKALSRFNITVATPTLEIPDDDGDDDNDGDGDDGNDGDGDGDQDDHRKKKKNRFIRDATFHLVSSSATFTLLSPLRHNTVWLEHINATAFYNHTENVGNILYDYEFSAPPGASETPRLPVKWSLGSHGYEKVRKALNGQLKLDAAAVVRIRIDNWVETLWYKGRGIGAAIRI